MDYTIVLILLASVFLGWGAGANDAASAVGTAIGAKTIEYRKGIAVVVLFSMLGFLLQGHAVSKTVGQGILHDGFLEANLGVVLAALISASLITFLTVLLSLPVSINHTLVGSVLGMGVILGMTDNVDYGVLSNVMVCWITTPLIALVVTLAIHRLVVTPIAKRMGLVSFARWFKLLSLLGVVMVSYTLGATAIATITSPILGSNISKHLPTLEAVQVETLLGVLIALAFGLGVVTLSGRVIRTLSTKIALLGPATAFSAQLSAALTVYGFVLLGLPASITHAVVGGIAAVGLMKGTKTLSGRTVGSILLGWMLTPLMSAAVAVAVYSLMKGYAMV